ncbi:MAG: cell division protein FtsZ [Phaeodactylibacter sp.]|nr:cell division protein FtsZ [Phaeodactylibacter sp.]
MVFDLPKDESPIIKVLGVGGGGSNAVTHMFKQGIVGVDFAVCNTDAQAMELSKVPTRIQLGPNLTEGRGAGSKPNIGKMACEESIEDVRRYLENNCRMLFITAGMGGGTGTGAAPIIAKTAKEMDILTVGIVTLPFTFEGRRRISQGGEGLEELKKHVDTLIVVSNDKLRQIHGNLSISEAFAHADNILTTAAKGIAEIITVPGYVNVDFEDVNTVMRDSGVAIMGTAAAAGDDRAKRAVDDALHSPLLEDNDIQGAQHILLNITSGTKEVTMDEIFEITEFVQEEAGYGTDLIWGNCYDESLGDKIAVTVIATGFEHRKPPRMSKPDSGRIIVSLDDELSEKKKKGLSDIGFEEEEDKANTFEFDDIPASTEKYRNRYSYQEPYLKDEDKEQREEERRKRMEEEQKRREKLRSHRVKLSNPKAVIELENEPAYMRRGVGLDDVPDSSEQARSKWTISDDDEPEIRTTGNSFLHDNVD